MVQEFWSYGSWEKDNKLDARVWNLADICGNGFVKEINIRSGMKMQILSYKYFKDHQSSIKSDKKTIDFYYCFSGFEKVSLDGSKKEVLFDKGKAGIFVKDCNVQGISKMSGKIPFYIITIQITPECFYDLNLDRFNALSEIIKRFRGASSYYNQYLEPTINIKKVADQLLNCPYSSPASNLYCEGKSLELIAGMVDSLEGKNKKKGRAGHSFHPDDIEKIHFAREILIKDMINPPSLDELARATGMNHVKLNRGFKEVFGTTVFGLLREIRLDKAKQLLMSGEMNVTEVSFSVGYSCISYFSKIFKEQYGHNPGACTKRYSTAG